MAFNAYLIFLDSIKKLKGESTSLPVKGAENSGAIEITDYSFGVTMPTTTGRSDGGGATVGRANFDVFTCNKNIDTATAWLFMYCCKGTVVDSAVLHLFRQGSQEESGVVEYAMVIFQHCVITKVGITGGGDELPKEALEFNYGRCEYVYQKTLHDTGMPDTARGQDRYGWSTITNREATGLQPWGTWIPVAAKKET